MAKILTILALAALTIFAARLILDASALEILIGPATFDTPPLMYAGIRG